MRSNFQERIIKICWLLGVFLALAPAGPGQIAAKVEMTETAQNVTMGNGLVKIVFSKKSATLQSLVAGGRDLLGSKGGGYTQIAFTSRHDDPKTDWAFQVVRQTPELVEIAFVNKSSDCPFDFASHYILRAGDSGFYNYLQWGHNASRTPGIARLAQYNFALRVDKNLFTTAAVDDQRISPFPKSEWLTEDKTVMDSTYKLPGGGYYSKYFFSAEGDEKNIVHGAMTDDGLGIWIIMPSHEHLNGGPEHQELTVHQAGDSQVLLAHAQGAHYGAGIAVSDSKDGSWSKVSAPWFIYVNKEPTQALAWQDAKRRAAQEVAAWPFRWLDPVAFQLNRGEVVGHLTFGNLKPVSGARVILADHEQQPTMMLWQTQWRNYRFYGWADQNGMFDIPKVRPGLYDLYVWQPGSFGCYLHAGIRVGEGAKVNLGELIWHQPMGRTRIFQIGIPDHSAQEFGFGDRFRQWGLWQQIAAATTHGVNFNVGKSVDRDWPFEMAVTQKPDLSWQVPVWNVQFYNAAPHTGKAVLSLGIAAYEGRQKPQLVASLNGQQVGAVSDLEISGAAHRSGIHAGYQEREITFDASKLKRGNNILTLEIPADSGPSSEPKNTPRVALLWDCVRLEVAE